MFYFKYFKYFIFLISSIHSQFSFGQHAHVPTNFTSAMLYHTRFRDCGDGIIEATWALLNFGDVVNYLDVPWGGVRSSVLRDILVAPAGGAPATLVSPMPPFGGTPGQLLNFRTTGAFERMVCVGGFCFLTQHNS